MIDDKLHQVVCIESAGLGHRRELRIEDAIAAIVDQRVEHRCETPRKDVTPRDATLASHDNDARQSHALTLHEFRSPELRQDVVDGRQHGFRETRLCEYRLLRLPIHAIKMRRQGVVGKTGLERLVDIDYRCDRLEPLLDIDVPHDRSAALRFEADA